MWSGLGRNEVGPRPSINIYQNWMRTSAIFAARAAQRRCPISSNLGQKYLFRIAGWNGRRLGSHALARPLHSIRVESQLLDTLASHSAQVLSSLL